MKSVFITGATGGLGINATLWALGAGLSVRATGRNTQVLGQLAEKGAKIYAKDLDPASSEELTLEMRGCDTVWHCAALATPWGPAADFQNINVLATQKLYEAARAAGVARFVNISTPSIYFDYRHRRDIPETFEVAKYVNAYASSKAEAEKRLNAMAQAPDAPHLTHLRPRAIFGPFDQVLFPRLMHLVKQRKGVLPLPDDGQSLLDLTFVDNVVHAMALASVTPSVSGQAYNVTNGEPMVLKDALTDLFARLGKPVQVKAMPYPVLDMAAKVAEGVSKLTKKEPVFTRYSIGALAFDMTLDITKIKSELGYRPQVSMSDALEQTAAWLKNRG